MPTMQRWLQVARVDEIADRDSKTTWIKDADIALFNLNGQYFAVDETLAPLGAGPSGSVDSRCVTNSRHTSEPHAARCDTLREHLHESAHTSPVCVPEGLIEAREEPG